MKFLLAIALALNVHGAPPSPKKPLPVGKLGYNLAVLKHFDVSSIALCDIQTLVSCA